MIFGISIEPTFRFFRRIRPLMISKYVLKLKRMNIKLQFQNHNHTYISDLWI